MVADCGLVKGKGATATTAALQQPGAAAPRSRGKAATAARPAAPGMAAQISQQRRLTLQGRALGGAWRPQAAARASVRVAPARAMAAVL